MSTAPVAINVKLNARLQPEHRLQLWPASAKSWAAAPR